MLFRASKSASLPLLPATLTIFSIHECYRKNYYNLALFGQMFAFLFKAKATPSPEARM
jgi:hypothetical protein